ncbi:MAG TPA: VWA domain-containing protein [Pyrinomonadaceae bacterium]|nr:VWA domain-containing protein [Pyrinomonadaceae bacterium]
MRSLFLLVLFASFVGSSAAQSGRAKATPSPTPRQITGPSAIYTPTQPLPAPKTRPTPTPETNPKLDDDVIKVDSALVPIPVAVLDERGRTLGMLKLTDFELKIDGKVVEIGDLNRSETPIRLAMLFDNSSSVLMARDFEKDAAVRFFRRVLRPERDLAALFSVADYVRREQPFTKDVDMLTQAIENFPQPAGATALLDGIIEGAGYLRSADGRRVMVIMSDGEDTYSDLRTTLDDVIKALQLANVQVFVVNTKDFENYKRTGVRGGNANTRTLTAERRMIEITQQTGGEVYSPIDEREMKDAFDQISAELSQQYILSYYPDDDARKRGTFREITLSVKGKPSYQIRTRKGYYVPRR